jgi:hypothetical protein
MKRLTGKQIVLWSLLLTAAIEAVTCILRFGLRLESTRDTASTVGALTGGIRVHHGYIGVLVLVIALACWRRWPGPARWTLVVAVALVTSDLVHHFAVLWSTTGSPEFHLVYPPV